jgi:Ca-activated chloride channel family protein
VKELVELATRHGILTPYTSFMADETTNLHDVAENASRATTRLESLAQTGGAAGTAQRAMKGDFQKAQQYFMDNNYSYRLAEAKSEPSSGGFGRFAAPAAPAATTKPSSHGRMGGMAMGGAGFGGMSGPAAAPALAAADAAGELSYGKDLAKEAEQAQSSVRNVGNRTFYRRQNQWVDSQLTDKQQQSARRVKQFSREYFDLANRYGRTMSQYLAMDEPVMLNMDGQAYLIEP